VSRSRGDSKAERGTIFLVYANVPALEEKLENGVAPAGSLNIF
jgi:hypothetical protein